MLTVSADPSPAFTLYSPSLEGPVAAADIQQTWYDRWGRWHPNYYYPPLLLWVQALLLRVWV
jgi:hypothetical protein